jgi:mannose-6-phosphate isomerase-like protein (cupin superfamily)
MDIREYKKISNLIRDNNTYRVYDLPTLKNLTLSLTELKIGKSTTGHSHTDVDEVYIFISGVGSIDIDTDNQKVKDGDVILIPRGKFHKVHNEGSETFSFWTVFEKYGDRK